MTERSSLSGYRRLIEATIARCGRFVPTIETSECVQVERGIILAGRLCADRNTDSVERLIGLSTRTNLQEIIVLDASRHRRAVYRPLLIYCWLLAYESSRDDRWEPALRKWCQNVRKAMDQIGPADVCTASNGATITEAIWAAMVSCVAGELFREAQWVDAGASSFKRICEVQQRNGAFLKVESNDNPETFWYHELILLQAVASFAARSGDAAAIAAADRNAKFHLNETQPDHATAQPWGLLAFIPHAPLLADQILHAMTTQQPNGIDGVSLMLLADTLYGLRRTI